jgi:DNA-binding FrmR family transcriptional regulator
MAQHDKTKLRARLQRIEGQVRGIARMIDEDRYCIDVVTQIHAVRGALSRVESDLLRGHLGHCIESAIVSGDAKEQRKKANELITLLAKTSR